MTDTITNSTCDPATAPASSPLAGSPRTPDMPDDIRQHVCTSAQGRYPATDMSRAARLERKERAISGKPFGPGSHTEKEGTTMTGAQAIIASLEAEGVDTVFGYPRWPGHQNLRCALRLHKRSAISLSRHEQGAVHEADGYARATGRVGVVIVTSGPGATNTVTGIAHGLYGLRAACGYFGPGYAWRPSVPTPSKRLTLWASPCRW